VKRANFEWISKRGRGRERSRERKGREAERKADKRGCALALNRKEL